MHNVLWVFLAEVTPIRRSNMPLIQIVHSWQRIITGPPHEHLDFIRSPKLPQTPTKFPIILQIGATCKRVHSTWYNQFISAASCKYTQRSRSPSNAIRRSPKTQRNSQDHICFVREEKLLDQWYLPCKAVLVNKGANSSIIIHLQHGRNNRAASLVWHPTVPFYPHRLPIPYMPNHPFPNNIPYTK